MIEMVTVTDGDATRVATAGGTLTFIAAASPINGNFLPAVAEGGEEREKKGRKRGEREKGGGRSSSDGPRSRGLLNAQNSLKIVRVGVKREGNPGGKPRK